MHAAHDVVIRGGTLYDGSGAPPFEADVAIDGDRIAAIGKVAERGRTQLDAGGLAVAPGFINMLSWATTSLIADGRSQSDIRQGVTLEVFGEGWSLGPVNDAMRREQIEQQGDIKYDIGWTTLAEALDTIAARGISPNIASFVGAATVRIHELAHEDRRPTADELGRMRTLVERQINGGVRLLVPCGTTGESATMSEAEDQRVIGLTVEVARGRAKVIAGAGSNSTAAAIEYSQSARDLGADAVLQVAPYYNKPTQEGLYTHFRAIAEAIPEMPIMLYNVPGRTSSNIAAQTVLRLANDCENIVAIKEASGNLSQIMEILRERPAGFRVLSGDDAVTLPLISLGAEGIVSVASNEVPDLMSRMTELALAGNWNEARELHYRLLPLMEVNFIESSPGPVKAAMAMMGLLEEHFRLPLVPITEKSRVSIREVIAELGLMENARATA